MLGIVTVRTFEGGRIERKVAREFGKSVDLMRAVFDDGYTTLWYSNTNGAFDRAVERRLSRKENK